MKRLSTTNRRQLHAEKRRTRMAIPPFDKWRTWPSFHSMTHIVVDLSCFTLICVTSFLIANPPNDPGNSFMMTIALLTGLAFAGFTSNCDSKLRYARHRKRMAESVRVDEKIRRLKQKQHTA